jgi:hypothetical protein
MLKMDLPYKPSDSAALLHYLFQHGHKNQCTAQVHKLATLWKALFRFELALDTLPSKAQVTQFALVTRALLYLYDPDAAPHLPTQVVKDKTAKIATDKPFCQAICTFVDTYMTKEEMKELQHAFLRPIGGSPVYATMFRLHQLRKTTMQSAHFQAWTTIANSAGDTNTTFKPSTLKLLPVVLRKGFEVHDLKKGKVRPKAKTRAHKGHTIPKARAKPVKPSKRKVQVAQEVRKKPTPSNRYPDPPKNGWMGLMTGTALCNFITHMNPISGQDLQLQMTKVDPSKNDKVVMLMKASVKLNFILQTTANMTLFRTSLKTIPAILVNSHETATIVKHFIKTAVFLLFDPANAEYDFAPTLTFASTNTTSSISFTMVVQMVDQVLVTKPKSTFHALSTISLAIKLLKPLMSLEKIKDIHVMCQVDNAKKRLHITFETPKNTKSKIVACHRFSAELAKASENTKDIPMDNVSLYLIDKSNMYTGKIKPSTVSETTNLKAYTQAQASNSLQTIFSETYKLGLLKAITKGIPCEQKICLVMTQERMLLMSVNEYRGSIQVAQLPNISTSSSSSSS